MPVKAVWAPLLKERISLEGEIDGVASKVAVKVPVWLAIEVLVKPLLLLMVAALVANDIAVMIAPARNILAPRRMWLAGASEINDAQGLPDPGRVDIFIVSLRYGWPQLL